MFGNKKNNAGIIINQKEKEEIIYLFSKKNNNYLKNLDILGKFLFKISFQSNIDSESFTSLLKECELRNKKFTDREFPPNQLSLIYSTNKFINNKWKKIKWDRASEYLKEYTIFPQKLDPGEIVQGVLNNNTFRALLDFTHNEKLSDEIFKNRDKYQNQFNDIKKWTEIVAKPDEEILVLGF